MNTLKVKTTNKGAKILDLKEMDNSDVIEVTKKFAEVRRTTQPSKFDNGKDWVSCSLCVEYSDEEKVYIGLPNHYTKGGYEKAEEFADRVDELGGEGDTIRISVVKGFGKDKKGNDIVVTDYTVEKVE